MEQIKWITVTLLLIGLLNSAHTRPSDGSEYQKEDEYDDDIQGDDNYDYKDEYKISDEDQNAVETNDAVIYSPPYFEISDDQREAKIGEDVTLFCEVKNFGTNNIVMWYNGTNVITNNKYSMVPRVTVVDNNAIVISDLQKADANDYYCEVLPSKIRFHVKLDVIGTRLAVFSHDRDVTNRSITFRQNERVEFECRAFETPKEATIKWALNGKRVEPPHVTSVADGKVVIDQVDYHHAGTYQCLGDDKSLRPLHASVTINVQFAPKVWTHRHHVNTQEHDSAQLYCNYRAEPIALPQWKKDGKYLPTGAFEKYKYENTIHEEHNSTILHVKDVQLDDLGDYECEVRNSIGTSHAKVMLQFEPETPQFEKIDISDNKITLQWLVRSHQPLVDVILDYQINGSHTWMSETVIKSEKHHEHTGVWKLRHELELGPGLWHARVKTKNTVGWSKFSPQYDFRVEEAISENSIPQDIFYATVVTGPHKNGAERLKMVPLPLVLCLLSILVPSLRNS